MASTATTEFSEAAPATFPQFERLPAELRLMIWEEAARVPRVVHLVERAVERTPSRFLKVQCVGEDEKSEIRTISQVPELFFVNHEARAVARKEYTAVSFECRLRIMNKVHAIKYVDMAPINLYMKLGDTLAVYKNCAKLRDGWVSRTHPSLQKIFPRIPIQNYIYVFSPEELKKNWRAIHAWITEEGTNKLPLGLGGLYTHLQTMGLQSGWARQTETGGNPKLDYNSCSVALDTMASWGSVPRLFDVEDLKTVPQPPQKEGAEPSDVFVWRNFSVVVNIFKLKRVTRINERPALGDWDNSPSGWSVRPSGEAPSLETGLPPYRHWDGLRT
ncbi:hypothetical protein F5Y18DRAFT_439396 [Xylariaceae sp. FL1019]|nr:hypothetical protein F5Y18DRAFT_439396 [Xylariaceae sp. FL1019]